MKNKRELLEKYYFPENKILQLIAKFKEGTLNTSSNIIKTSIEVPEEFLFESIPKKDSPEYKTIYDIGKKSMEAGELGVVILNGGMATRFGGLVKGTVEVFDGMSFLELKIKSSIAVSDKISFFIMNSFATDEKTQEHIEQNEYFGVKDQLSTFNQFIAPRINLDGSFFESGNIYSEYYGPGHGDFPFAFRKSGLLEKFIQSGGKYIFFSNVDNLGARIDPALLGYHILRGNQLSAEVASKSPGDEGGAPALVDGNLQLVEGFSFPEKFDSSAISVFNCSTYWVNADSLLQDFDLPWYIVRKNVSGHDVIQFEHLAGDLSALLTTTYIKILRNDRFFPIKRPEDLEKSRDKLKALLQL